MIPTRAPVRPSEDVTNKARRHIRGERVEPDAATLEALDRLPPRGAPPSERPMPSDPPPESIKSAAVTNARKRHGASRSDRPQDLGAKRSGPVVPAIKIAPPPTKPPQRALDVIEEKKRKEAERSNRRTVKSDNTKRPLPATKRPPEGAPPQRLSTQPKRIPGPPPGAPPPEESTNAMVVATKKTIPGPPPSDTMVRSAAPSLSVSSANMIPGRLFVKIFAGNNVQKHEAKSALRADLINPFVELQVGSQKHRSNVLKKQNKYPDWQGQTLFFDLLDPKKMLDPEGDLPLVVRVFAKGTFSNTLLGETSISIMPYFEEFVGERDEYDLLWTHKKTGRTKDAGSLELQLTFQPAYTGVLVVKLHHGKDLKNMDAWGKQDPYCKFEIGSGVKRKSKVIKDGGTNPYFGEEELEFWVDHRSWMHPLKMTVWDEDIGSDDFIGGRDFSVLPFMSQTPGESVRKWIPILDKKKEKAGELEIGFAFYPAGRLNVHLRKGRHLYDADNLGKQDPYVKLTLLSKKWGDVVVKSKTDTDGGTEPVWDQTLSFSVVDQYEMRMEVFDEDVISKDDIIGKQKVSLLAYFKRGIIEEWVPIHNRDRGWGQEENAGEIFIKWEFLGPPGVAYPQRQPLVDSFDDRDRVNRRETKEEKEALAKFTSPTKRSGVMVESKFAEADRRRHLDEFSDKEISDAFQLFDLDRNNFVGAAELRHCLICMGELVTDEEISEMIRMVDLDGDGQVSFEEFHHICTHPDPSRPDFLAGLSAKNAVVIVDGGKHGGVPPPPNALPGTKESADQKMAKKQKLMARKAEKKQLLVKFQEDHNVDVDFLLLAFKKFRDGDANKTGEMDFETFCAIMQIEPIGEYRRLFSLYDQNDSGRIDVREFMLGLANFSSRDHDKKARLCFELFDEDRNGFITKEELTKILQANHMEPNPDAVKRKCMAIMRQGDKDGDNRISPVELVDIATKFPNILFPAYSAPKARRRG